MTAATQDENLRQLSFYKGGQEVLGGAEDGRFDWDAAASTTRQSLTEAMNARHLAFLMGSGCSSLKRGSSELGVPTMAPLAHKFLSTSNRTTRYAPPTQEEVEAISSVLGIDVRDEEFSWNLERLMEVLFSVQFVLEKTTNESFDGVAEHVDSLVDKVVDYICYRCTNGKFSHGDDTVVNLYQGFYRRLICRDRTLPSPWVFTTNYDLFNETALDRMGLPYCNGFSGTVERRFNPSTYRYALAEQLDLSSRRWTAVDGFVYLCKLHGSVNWIEEESGLFPIREVPITDELFSSRVMIHPTPAKQNASFGSPYSDMFREFQSRIVREQSVLVVLGYGFGDEHINNIIYQALTVPSFRLVVFADPDAAGPIEKLRKLEDPRIWLIGGQGPTGTSKAHYFDTVVAKFLPEEPGGRVNDAVTRVLESLLSGPRQSCASEDDNED